MTRELGLGHSRPKVAEARSWVAIIAASIETRVSTVFMAIPENNEFSIGTVYGEHTSVDSTGARGDERRAMWHAGAIGQPPRTLRSTRAGLFLHDQLRRLAKNATFPAAVKVMIKTLSTEAAAWTVPPAIGPDRASPF